MKLANAAFLLMIISIIISLITLSAGFVVPAIACTIIELLSGIVIWNEFRCAWKWM